MNKKEPTRYSMSTGLPVNENEEVQKYSMNDDEVNAEQAFLNFIQKAKESKKKYNLWLEEKESKDST
jgi:hypothetical protein